MPMIDFYCPEGALDGEASAAALEEMTEAARQAVADGLFAPASAPSS